MTTPTGETDRSRNARVGTTLCERHAVLAAGLGRPPTGPCAPTSEWLSGAGDRVVCDVLAAPERVEAYMEHVRSQSVSTGQTATSAKAAAERRIADLDKRFGIGNDSDDDGPLSISPSLGSGGGPW